MLVKSTNKTPDETRPTGQTDDVLHGHAAQCRYFDLFNLSPVGCVTLDKTELILEANDAVSRLFGVAQSSLVHTPLTRFILAADQDNYVRYRNQLLEAERTAGITPARIEACEVRMLRAGTDPFWARIVARAERNTASGSTVRLAVITDITEYVTEYKHVEELLRRETSNLLQSSTRYRSYLEVTGQLDWTTDADGQVIEDLSSWRHYTGQKVEETMGLGWLDAVHPDDRTRVTAAWRDAVAERKSYEAEYRLRRHDGVYRHFLVRGMPTPNADGTTREWVGSCVDITDRKRFENTLRFLAQTGGAPQGEDFFHTLAPYLAMTMGIDCVYIASFNQDIQTARTVVFYADGRMEDRTVYPLEDTPCASVLKAKVCCFPRNVRQLFPKDNVLQRFSAESFAGAILLNSQQQPIGIIAVIGRQPMANPAVVESILQLVAVRASGELDRRNAEVALIERNEELARFNRAAVDRELRMIELKRQVNDLLVKAGLPSAYNLEFDKEER